MFNQAQHSIINEFQKLSTSDQLKYLQEENIFLKSIITDARPPNSEQKTNKNHSCNNESSFICKCHEYYINLLNKYETFLENLTQQLLNSLQMQDAIRYELSHIENVKPQTRVSICGLCKVSSTTNKQQLNETTNVGYPQKYFDESINSIYRFQLLLNQQQDQQLKMFNDICTVSKLLRVQKSELIKPVASNFFGSKNLFKSASSYISFITEQYEIAERKTLSLSQIGSLKLSTDENFYIYSDLNVLLNNNISKLDLINFDDNNKFNRNQIDKNDKNCDDRMKIKPLLDELNEFKEILCKETDQEVRTRCENKAHSKFNDTILKEINFKYERPIILNITGHTVKIEQNLESLSQMSSLPNETEIPVIQPKIIPLFENKQNIVTSQSKTKASTRNNNIQSKIPKLNKSLNDSVNTSSSSLQSSLPETIRLQSQPKSNIPQLQRPKVLKPTVFKQPFKPSPTPVRKPKNQRISIVKPVKKPSYQHQQQNLINSNTFDKKRLPEIKKPYVKPYFNPKKRYCFPTLQSASIYYNNQLFTQFNEYLNTGRRTSFKYLSDSDINSLANRLSLDEKDPLYNVYHLDTLYNNIDYILFNSYASDTELTYDLNRQHNERTKQLISSNYKLFIQDYFNKNYDEESNEANDQNHVIIEKSEEEEIFDTNASNELVELEFDEYDIQEDSLLLNVNNEYDMEVDGFDDYQLDSPGVELEILKFESESMLSSSSKKCFYTESSTFNDVYLQITDDDNQKQSNLDKMYFESVQTQQATAPILISVSSLSSLFTTSKSFNAGNVKFNTYEQNEISSLLNSSIDLSDSLSSLTHYTNLTPVNSQKSKNKRPSSYHHREQEDDHEYIFEDDWTQNLDLTQFKTNIDVRKK